MNQFAGKLPPTMARRKRAQARGGARTHTSLAGPLNYGREAGELEMVSLADCIMATHRIQAITPRSAQPLKSCEGEM